MLVKDLIAMLEKLPQDLEVILQEDPEGNGYRKCRGVAGAMDLGGYYVDSDDFDDEIKYLGTDEYKEYKDTHVIIFP